MRCSKLSKVNIISTNKVLILLFLTVTIAVVAAFVAVPLAQASTVEAAGRLYGWGQNDRGQLGDGTFTDRHSLVRLPAPPGGAADWNELEIIQGNHHTKALTSDGRLYVWGWNEDGALGIGHFDNEHTPVENTNLPAGVASWNDVEFMRAGHATFVRTSDGRLYVWGRNVHGQLGLGHTDDVHTPTINNNLPAGVTNWNDVEFILGEFIGNNCIFVRTSDGRLYVWGQNNHGQLGLGFGGVAQSTPTEHTNFPADITSWDDVEIIPGASHVFWRTSDGRLFGTGTNTAGQLGLGHNSNIHTGPIGFNHAENTNLPAGLSSWNDLEFMATLNHTRALSTDGRLFVWGLNDGHLGLGHLNSPVNTLTENTNLPAGVTSWNDVEFIVGSQQTYVLTTDGRLFGWGLGDNGRVGLGNTNHVYTPTELTNLPVGVEDWNDMEMFTGANAHIFARVRPMVVPLTKTLQLNEGTQVPAPAPSFTFTFERVQIALNDAAPPRMSNPLTGTGAVPNIPNQTITVVPTTVSTSGGITTVTGALNLWELIVDVLNAANITTGGVFVWEVTEVPNSSNINASPAPNTMTYDTSRFQIRAQTNRYGDLRIVELLRMQQVSGNWQTVLPKLEDGIEFINTYTRTVGTNERAALYISKNVVGEMANLSLPFTFTLTLTNPTITPPVIGTVNAEIVNATTGASFSPPRNVNLTAGTNPTFTLAHNEKLRIPQLPAGTRFQVTEAARPQFMPQATITGSIPVLPATGTYPQQAVDTALPTGTYIIHQTEINRASFTNTYVWDVPAGLLITSTPWAALGVVALLLTLLLATRNRKRIEEIPLVL